MQLAPFYPFLHRVLKPTFPDCLWSGCQNAPTVALTFDDGPHPRYTPALLEALNRYHVPASFFLLGSCVDRHPEIAKTIHQQGHWLGLHGYEHQSFVTMKPDELKRDLQKTQKAIIQACQPPQPLIDVRPPYGLFTPSTLSLLNQWSYRSVMWSVIAEDWLHPGVSIVVQRVLEQVQNGSVIVLHDGDEGGRDVAEIVDRLIPALLKRGYRLSTIDQLWNSRMPSNV